MKRNKKYQFNIINNNYDISYLKGKYKINNNNYLYYNISDINYVFSLTFNIIKVEYKICINDDKNNLINPSNIILFYNISFTCHYYNTKFNISIDSLPNIYKNKYFECIEFLNINEKIIFGIKIHKINYSSNFFTFYFLQNNIFNYHSNSHKNNRIFDPLIINKEYYNLLKNNNDKKNNSLKLIKKYKKKPSYILKGNYKSKECEWIYYNLYNHNYCFYKGKKCLNIGKSQSCKYYFYINVIDKNKNIYLKKDYLFIDFIYSNMPSDDTYPVFEKMKKQKLSVHYITERRDIYNKYCYKIKNCLTIISINRKQYKEYGDFVEKYIGLLLKLKAVISGKIAYFHFVSKLFYNLDYLTYIAVGHGVCYFKYFLYKKNDIYGINKNNKLLLPPSNIIINVAKKYGWKDKDIIKINLPRWDKYNIKNLKFKKNEELKNNSIFIMFTWRSIRKGKSITSSYIKNIFELLNNNILQTTLLNNNITLYFSLHRLMLYKYEQLYKQMIKNNPYIIFLNQLQISQCLYKTNLVVSDFSSIVFELIYRRKPVIIFIPDAYDSKIKEYYKKDYLELIESLKNKRIFFENKYFTINDTINKIIYYINNNFTLDLKLKKFYDSFGFKKGYNINKFIKYLKKLK